MKRPLDWVRKWNWTGQTESQLVFQIEAIQLDARKQAIKEALEKVGSLNIANYIGCIDRKCILVGGPHNGMMAVMGKTEGKESVSLPLLLCGGLVNCTYTRNSATDNYDFKGYSEFRD